MTNKFSEILASTPAVSYTKAIDIYMMFCVFLVFITLLEFTLLYWIRQGRREYNESRALLHKKLYNFKEGKEDDDEEKDPKIKGEEDPFYAKIRNYIEVYGFLLTIIGFLVFNLIYWFWLLVASDYLYSYVDLDYNKDY